MWLRPVSTEPDHVAEVQVDRARLELPPDPLVMLAIRPGRGENSPTSGSPIAASRSQGCGPPTSTQLGLHPGDARARKHSVPLRLALPVREHVEPVGPGAQSVDMLLRQVDQHVVLPDLEGLAVLPRDPGAAEDEEDLLLRTLGSARASTTCRRRPGCA